MWIICDDNLLANALQIALRQRGIDAEIRADLQPRKSDTVGYIVDLDCIPADTPLPSPAITFSRFSEKGADLTRPFLFSEFCDLAVRRFSAARPLTTPVGGTPILELLSDSVLVCGKQIALSPSEHALLRLLFNAGGECVPTSLIDELWHGGGSNTTAVYISYLRKKIATATDLHLIRSVRGKGYCLCLPQ